MMHPITGRHSGGPFLWGGLPPLAKLRIRLPRETDSEELRSPRTIENRLAGQVISTSELRANCGLQEAVTTPGLQSYSTWRPPLRLPPGILNAKYRSSAIS